MVKFELVAVLGISFLGLGPCQGLIFGGFTPPRPLLSDFAFSPTRIFQVDKALGPSLLFAAPSTRLAGPSFPSLSSFSAPTGLHFHRAIERQPLFVAAHQQQEQEVAVSSQGDAAAKSIKKAEAPGQSAEKYRS